MKEISSILQKLQSGDKKALARCITIVENDLAGSDEILTALQFRKNTPVIGITGPPGAGKSTLVNELIRQLVSDNKQIGVIAVDPTSPFNYGSLLGDRLRMSDHFNNENVFIRSLATRGALGGLSAKTIEIADVMRAFGFDYIFVETVGVGQSEVEIVGLADTTILVLVPESGDEVQVIKSGIMEIADIFVVNKSDREGAGAFSKNLHELLHSKKQEEWSIPVIKAAAVKGEGVSEIIKKINEHQQTASDKRRVYLLAEKAYRLIQNHRMKDIGKDSLLRKIEKEYTQKNFNLYAFVKKIIREATA